MGDCWRGRRERGNWRFGCQEFRLHWSQGHPLGLGGAPLSESSFAHGVATIRHGLDEGLSYFDTSPPYGQGQSQAIYGQALTAEDRVFLFATKLGHFRDRKLYRSVDALRAQLHENIRLLRRQSVDLLQVHEADFHA
jgi:L-galactose dehydrogenase